MLYVNYITNRGLKPIVKPDDDQLGQYQLLADTLSYQTLPRDRWRLVVTDEKNELPRPELEPLGDVAMYARPPKTPWRERNSFSAASARNAGLRRILESSPKAGSVVLGLDDCCRLPADLLEQVEKLAGDGMYLAPFCCTASRRPSPRDRIRPRSSVGGIVAYPLDAAVEVRMHEERFDGAISLEDIEFGERLQRVCGVRFVENDTKVFLLHHDRAKRRRERCGTLVHFLLRESHQANVPWTNDQLKILCGPCPFCSGSRCQINKGECKGPITPTEEAVSIMKGYESKPWPW